MSILGFQNIFTRRRNYCIISEKPSKQVQERADRNYVYDTGCQLFPIYIELRMCAY